jgi:putative DNA primase/helicase
LHGAEHGKVFAEHLGELCKSFYGSAGLEFVRCLLPTQERVIHDSRTLMTELSKKFVPVAASGQVHRAFNRFSLIAIAGELAITFGITNWPEGAAIEAAVCCFHDWLRARGDMGPQEERAILSQVRHFFEQHGDSRFTPWLEDDHEKHGKTQMRAGYRKLCEEGEEFFVFLESFKREICSGFDPELVAQVCLKHGLLMSDSKGGATRSERLPGAKTSTRVYRFTSNVLVEG